MLAGLLCTFPPFPVHLDPLPHEHLLLLFNPSIGFVLNTEMILHLSISQ